MTDDQDLYDWRRTQNRKEIKKAVERAKRLRREEVEDILSRYGRELPIDDNEPPPRVD